MSENITAPVAEVVEEVAAPAVEASRTWAHADSTFTASSTPVFTTAPRSPITTAGSLLEHTILAAQGNSESAQYVAAANDSTGTSTGFTLPTHANEMISATFGGRPAIDAVSKGVLPASGLSFTIPNLTTAPGASALDEGDSITVTTAAATGLVSNYKTVTIQKYYSSNTVSFELLDRSNPNFYNILIEEMGRAYAKAQDKDVLSAFAASGTSATATAATAAGLLSFLSVEAAAAFKGTSEYAKNLVASTDMWAAIMGFADSAGRPIYSAANPQNAGGQVAMDSLTGNVLGANLYVDPNITPTALATNSAYLVCPNSVTVYESPQTRLQVNLIGTGEVQIGLYGYMGIAVKKPLGVRKWTKSA